MAEAKRQHDWNVASTIMALMAEMNRDRKRRRKPFKPDDFNPYADQKPIVARGTVEQAVVEKEDPSNPERNIELKKNYEIFSAEIGKLHKSEMEVNVFTVPAIKFLELNPDVHSFLGKLWILLEDLIVGQSSEEVEALMNFDPIEIPTENAKKSKIVTE